MEVMLLRCNKYIYKKGREGNHSNLYVDTGSNNKKSITYSIDGADEKFNSFLSEMVSLQTVYLP